MPEFNEDAFQDYYEKIKKLSARRTVNKPWKVGSPEGAYSSDGGFKGDYSGVFAGKKGFSYRVTLNSSTREYTLWMSKSAINLKGERGDFGSVHLSKEGASKSYPVGAPIKLDDNGGNKHSIFKELSRRMIDTDPYIGDRARHYRYTGVSFDNIKTAHTNVNQVYYGGGTDLFFNLKGYDAYTVDQQTGAAQKHISAYRDKEGEHFNRVSFGKSLWKNGISRVSKTLFEGKSEDEYLTGRMAADDARRECSEAVYEQRNLYSQPGLTFYMKSMPSRIVNFMHARAETMIPKAFVVGLTYMKEPAYGLSLAASVTAYHLLFDVVSDETWKEMKTFGTRTARKAFGNKVVPDDDAQKSLKGYGNILFDRHNLYKSMPHVDLDVCKPEESICIPPEDVKILNGFLCADMVDDIDDAAFEFFVLQMHQLNLSMKEYWFDKNTCGFESDNGTPGVFKIEENGDLTVYAFDNRDLCVNDALATPEEYRERINGGFAKVSVRRSVAGVIEAAYAYKKGLTGQDVYKESCDSLFSDQPYVQNVAKDRSLKSMREFLMPHLSMREAVYESDQALKQKHRAMGLVTLPFAEAVDDRVEPVLQEDENAQGSTSNYIYQDMC